jgi:hypothetical protein
MSNLKVIDEWLENQKQKFLNDYREVKMGGKGFASISGKFLLVTGWNQFSVINSENLETLHSFSIEFKKELSFFQFLTQDQIVFIGNDSKRLLLYSISGQKVLSEFKAQYTLSNCIHVQSPELFWVATQSNLLQMRVTTRGNATKLEAKVTKSMKTASINDITGNHKILVIGNSDKSLVVLSIKSLHKKKELKSIHSGKPSAYRSFSFGF